MSFERRLALLAAAGAAGAWVVEDDYDGEFFFGGRPPPTLKSADTTGLVIYVGTFSKSLFPALRLGYVLAPPALVDTFRTLMSRFLPGVPSHLQGVVAAFIDEGHFAAHVRRMRLIYQERHAALLAAASRQLTGMLEVAPARSGLHTVGYLAPRLHELEVCMDAQQQGVTVSPIGRFAIRPVDLNGLVLGFGSVPPAAIETGIEVLARVLETRLHAR
jgi:GntR family transcriptional regulator / MocR family aminotransferase